MLKKLNMFNLYLLLTFSFLSGLASAQDIDFQPFGGASRNGDTYRFPSGSESWAGFANANTALYPISISQPGEITFNAYVPSGSSASVYFRFEKNPYPDTEPSFNTSSVTVTGDVPQSYSVKFASQGGNTFRSFLLYVVERDVDVVVTDIILSVDSGSSGDTCSSPAVCHDEEGGYSIAGGESTNYISESCVDTVSGVPVDDTKWFHQIIIPSGGSWFNGELQHYTSCLDNSYVSNGTLKIVAKSESFWDQGHHKNYTSARLNSKFAFQYGRVEFKAKMPEGVGTWPAVWMLGKDITENGAYYASNFGATPWPATGEIDILEHWGKNQNYAQSAMHTPSSYGGTENHGGQYISTISEQFHVYEMYWDKNEIIFSVNGNEHYTYNPSVKDANTWPYDKEFFLLLNVAVENSGFLGFDQAAMELDYIRVYNLDGDLIFSDEFNSGDSDGDGFADDVDALPNDPDEHLDTDDDGIGNNADPDDDNDNYPDISDDFPLDSSEWLDTDEDGIGDNADTNDDDDDYPDSSDDFPLDSSEWLDTDNDGIGNNADPDDDNDGFDDLNDDLPLDSTEHLDTDRDGIGNNADTDDDGDGVADVLDACPLDINESVDTDGDTICNNTDDDDDGDGILDVDDVNPLVPDLNKQIVLVSNSPNGVVGGQVSLEVGYDTSTGDNQLNGLGLRVHYDSNILEFIAIDNILQTDIFIEQFISEADTSDFDANPATDSFVTFAWASITSKWPDTALPADLFTMIFKVKDTVSPDTTPSTTIEFSSTSGVAGYTFEASSYQLGITDLTWDFDGNGHADALTDGLLFLRHAFELTGNDLTKGSIATNSPLSASDVEALLNDSHQIADIDNSGHFDALTDGLLLLRYLFEYRGETLLNGAVHSNAQRTQHSEIEQYISDHMPAE